MCSGLALCQRQKTNCPHTVLQTQPRLATALISVSRLNSAVQSWPSVSSALTGNILFWGGCQSQRILPFGDTSAFGKMSPSWDWKINSYMTYASLEQLKIGSLVFPFHLSLPCLPVPHPTRLSTHQVISDWLYSRSHEFVTILKWSRTLKSDFVK